MYEVPLNIFYIIMYPEILLSLTVLGLIVHQLSTLKITAIVLILISIWVPLGGMESGDLGINWDLRGTMAQSS